VVVVPDTQTETFILKGVVFTAPVDGVFMGDARYQRYRRAIADVQMSLTTTNKP